MTDPPWRIGSPSFSWRKTSHGSRTPLLMRHIASLPAPRARLRTHKCARSRARRRLALHSPEQGRTSSRDGARRHEDRVADPLGVGPAVAPELEPLLGLWAVIGHDGPELVPVRLGVAPFAGGLVEVEVRVGQGEPQLADPR